MAGLLEISDLFLRLFLGHAAIILERPHPLLALTINSRQIVVGSLGISAAIVPTAAATGPKSGSNAFAISFVLQTSDRRSACLDLSRGISRAEGTRSHLAKAGPDAASRSTLPTYGRDSATWAFHKKMTMTHELEAS